MIKKRGPGRPPKKRRGRPPVSKNKIITGLKQTLEHVASQQLKTWHVVNNPQDLEYVKDYNEIPSFRSRLEAATVKFEQAVNETIEQLKGKM